LGDAQAAASRCETFDLLLQPFSFYEGAGEGPNVAKVKEALKKEATKK